ncbi:phosphatase PAP2 family protein [Solimonas flava]|uniref:phosphatase PAP2 family protein n=1 Tax=Solimonas flava TaxID=415849 RepID=UPI0003FE3F6A|nr:phosphatase PAP2 family protein [Solimonas flava]
MNKKVWLSAATAAALTLAWNAAEAAGLTTEIRDDPDRAAGDIFQILNPLVATGFTLYKHDYQGTKEYAYNFAATFAATQALKYAFNNTSWGERPNGHDGSFPSGHTSSACSAAAFMSDRYGWMYGLPLYGTALFTGYSRVDEHFHHWRDVIAGCALAVGVSKLITTRYQEEHRLSIAPIIDRDTVGLQLHLDFAP